jgi:hypothetical protein
MSLPNEIILHLLSWINLDDWAQWRLVNKEQTKNLSHIHSWMLKICKERFWRLLGQTNLNIERFTQVLQEQKGEITGSIWIELLLGKESFEAGDIDVFVLGKDWDPNPKTSWESTFTPLHQLCYEAATNLPSSKDIQMTKSQRKRARRVVSQQALEIHAMDKWNIDEYEIDNLIERSSEFSKSLSIRNVYEYDLGVKKLQIIGLLPLKHTKAHYGVTTFIQTQFDWKCCMGMFDGRRLKLSDVIGIHQRLLNCGDEYLKRAQFFYDWQRASHEKHLAKYRFRGFTLGEIVPQCGRLQKVLHDLDLRAGSYTLDELVILCEKELQESANGAKTSPKYKRRWSKIS